MGFNSLALLTGAAHPADVVPPASWYAVQLTAFINERQTYGYHQAGILAALASSYPVVDRLGYFLRSRRRFGSPPEVQAGILVVVGSVAFVINLATAWLVHKGSRQDLNLRSVFVHLMGDVLSTIGAVGAGTVMLFTGWNWLDPLVSVFAKHLDPVSMGGILRDRGHPAQSSARCGYERMVGVSWRWQGAGCARPACVEHHAACTQHRAFAIEDLPVSAGAAIQMRVNEMLAPLQHRPCHFNSNVWLRTGPVVLRHQRSGKFGTISTKVHAGGTASGRNDMIRNIIWDVDGTLFDTYPAIVRR
jgi:cobalt-zinc-cadmium efflux system protein